MMAKLEPNLRQLNLTKYVNKINYLFIDFIKRDAMFGNIFRRIN